MKPNQNAVPDAPVTEIMSSEATIEAIERASIDMQVATAHAYPRVLSTVKEKVQALATVDADTAAACNYRLPARKGGDGQPITGESVQFARILAQCWGNLRVGVISIVIEDRFVVVRSAAHDLETNYAPTTLVRRRITNKHGKRYGDDMIMVTANAAAAISIRNAIFEAVPRALFHSELIQIKDVARGDADTLPERLQKCIDFFYAKGVDEGRVLALVDRRKVDDVTLDDLIRLRGLVQSVTDSEISIAELFAIQEKEKATDEMAAGRTAGKPTDDMQDLANASAGSARKMDALPADDRSGMVGSGAPAQESEALEAAKASGKLFLASQLGEPASDEAPAAAPSEDAVNEAVERFMKPINEQVKSIPAVGDARAKAWGNITARVVDGKSVRERSYTGVAGRLKALVNDGFFAEAQLLAQDLLSKAMIYAGEVRDAAKGQDKAPGA